MCACRRHSRLLNVTLSQLRLPAPQTAEPLTAGTQGQAPFAKGASLRIHRGNTWCSTFYQGNLRLPQGLMSLLEVHHTA